MSNAVSIAAYAQYTNLADGQPTAQSTTSGSSTSDSAVDSSLFTCAEARNNDPRPWWAVDLGDSYDIYGILLSTCE